MKVILDLDDRKIQWQVDQGTMALLLQNFVQVLGPAQEYKEN